MQTLSQSPQVARSFGEQPAVYLIYLAFYFVPWFFNAPSNTDILAAIVSLVVFVLIYLDAHRKSGLASLPHVIAMALIGYVMSNFSGAFGVFHIYAMVQAAFMRPAREAILTMIALSAAYILFVFAIDAGFWDISVPLLIGAIASLGCLATADTIEINNQREQNRQFEKNMAALNERERIAQDLHDALGQTLTMVALKSELAAKQIKSAPNNAEQEIKDIKDAAHKALNEMRKVVSDLSETSIEAELERANKNFTTAGITLSQTSVELELSLTEDRLLGLCLREIFTNILRHSQASHVTVESKLNANEYSLSISDNGIGLNQRDHLLEGSGLNHIRRRLEQLNGQMKIEYRKGLSVTLSIPKRNEDQPHS